MSAFICSNKSISRVAIYVWNLLDSVETIEFPDNVYESLSDAFASAVSSDFYDYDKIYDLLYALNVDSVNYLYDENTPTDKHDTPLVRISDCEALNIPTEKDRLPQIWQTIRMFCYQSSEKDEDNAILDSLYELCDCILDKLGIPNTDAAYKHPDFQGLEWDLSFIML